MSYRNSDYDFRDELDTETQWEKVIKFRADGVMGHFNDSVESVNDLFSTAEKMVSEGETEQAESIWRSQVILLASALDFYMHEITKYGLDEINKGNWDITHSFERLSVPMKNVRKGIAKEGGSEWFLEYVNNHYLHTSLIAYKSIEEQLKLLGIDIRSVAEKIYPDCRESSREAIKKLKCAHREFCDRRNDIAHQTDRSSRNAVKREITKDAVDGFISYITDLVKAIDAAVREKDAKHSSASEE